MNYNVPIRKYIKYDICQNSVTLLCQKVSLQKEQAGATQYNYEKKHNSIYSMAL